MKKRLSLLFTVMLALSIFLSGCGFSDTGTQKNDGDTEKGEVKEKVANLSLINDIPDLNQVLTTDGISFSILNNVMEGLYRLDADNNPQPAMAESVDVSDDKLTYTFHLREGIKWSNGDPVTAEDFKYSWLRAMHPETSGSYADILYNYIVGGEEFHEGEADATTVAIEAKDEKTLEVKLKKPTPFFLGLTAFVTYFPLNEKFIDEIGDEKFALTSESILYNGPFVLTEYNQATGVTLKKNEHYWDLDNVDLDKVTMKVIKEQSTALNLYEAGELDRVYLASADVDNYRDNAEFGTETDFTSWYLQFNFLEKPFDNVNIRKAFQLAYDQSVLTENILNNGSEPAYGLVAAGVYGNEDKTFRELNGDIIKPDYEKAKKYLAKGIEEIGELPPLEILTADDTIAKDTATFLQSEFKKNLDVDVQIVTKPYSGRLDAMRENDYLMGISRWGSDYNDALDILDLWKGDPPRGLRGSYSSEEFAGLIDSVIDEKDEEKRLQMLLDAEKLMLVDDGTLGPLYFEGQAFLQKSYMTDFVTHPYGASVDLKYIKIKE